jgi:hypothetical protein
MDDGTVERVTRRVPGVGAGDFPVWVLATSVLMFRGSRGDSAASCQRPDTARLGERSLTIHTSQREFNETGVRTMGEGEPLLGAAATEARRSSWRRARMTS